MTLKVKFWHFLTTHHYSNSPKLVISFDYSWFWVKNLFSFVPLPWKLHNRYCHILYMVLFFHKFWYFTWCGEGGHETDRATPTSSQPFSWQGRNPSPNSCRNFSTHFWILTDCKVTVLLGYAQLTYLDLAVLKLKLNLGLWKLQKKFFHYYEENFL